MNDDVLARRLLGWQTTEDEDVVVGVVPASTTSSVIQRALTLLSSEDECILDFSNHPNNSRRDPLSIVIGYHQLISTCLDNGGTAAPLSSLSFSSRGDSNECIKLACDIFRRANDKIISALRDSSSSSGGNKINNNGPMDLALRHLRMIIGNIHTRVVADIRLMGPIYRGFCSLAEVLNSTLSLGVVVVEDNIPSSMNTATALLLLDQEFTHVLESASTCLLQLGLLDEGLNWVETMLLRMKDSSETSSSTTTTDNYDVGYDYSREIKKKKNVIIFLLARVTSLAAMSIAAGDRRHRRSSGAAVAKVSLPRMGGKKKEEDSGIGLVRRLIRCASLSLLAEAIFANDSINKSCTDGQSELFDMAKELGVKAERFLLKLLLGGDILDHSRGGTSAAFVCGRVLECFIDMPSSSLQSYGEDDKNAALVNVSIGKLKLMKKILCHVFVTANLSFVIPSRTLIDFIECVLFVDIPACYHLLRHLGSSSTTMRILQRRTEELLAYYVQTLENASHSLCLPVLDDEGDAQRRSMMIQQHQLLIRWLAPTASARYANDNRCNHSLTNEVLLHIIQRRITLSCSVNDDGHSPDDAAHLTSLLSQLLFQQQTEVSHRRNIATLLIRLLSLSSGTTVDASKELTNVTQELTNVTQITRQSLWVKLKQSGVLTQSRRRKRKKSNDITITDGSSMLQPDDMSTICLVLEALAKSGRIDNEVSGDMRSFWQDLLSDNFIFARGSSREVDRIAFLLSLSVGVAKASSKLSDFFLAFDADKHADADGVLPGNISPKSILDNVLNFVTVPLLGRINKRSNSVRRIVLQYSCISLIDAISECVGREFPETQVERMSEILKDTVVLASASESNHAIVLQHLVTSTASNMGSAIRSDFNDKSLRQLAECINYTLAKSSWYYVAPCISSLDDFLQTLPKHLKGIVNKMPELARKPSMARMLFTARLKKEVFSIAMEETIDPTTLPVSYAVQNECRFLLWCCNGPATKYSLSYLGDESILLKSGSKVYVQRKEGKVVTVVITSSDGEFTTSSEILSAINTCKFDSHSMKTNCEIRL